MPLYTFGDAAGSSSDERGNSREASNEDEEDGYEYDENGAIVDDEEDYDEDGSPIAHEPHKGARMSPMMVYVETLTGTAFEVRVSSFEAVISIKDKIQRLEGIPISQQHLLYDNMEMRDDYTLRDYNIRNGATLRLVLGMRGGPINTRRVPVEDPVLRDMDLLEAKEQLSRRLSSSSNNHFTILVLRNGQQVNLYRVVDRNDGSASASSVSSGGSRCDKVSASVGTTAAQRDNESGHGEDCDEDDEDEVEEDEEASDKSEDENHHGGRKAEVDVDEPTRMAVKLANLRMKMHQNKRGNKTTFGKINNARAHEDSLMLGPSSKPTSTSNTSLPPILNGQPAGRYKYQRSLLSNPVPTNPVTVKGQSKDYQQPQPRYLRMKSLHGILANERTEILETNEEDAQEGDISSEMGANQDIAGPSKSNFDKAQYLSGNNESSLGIMPRTSYAISQIIDPSAEQSNYNLLKDQQGSTTSSGQIIGGPHHSLAKSLYNRDTVTNLTANDDDFARMRKRSNCRNEEAGSGENSNEEVKSYAFKSMPFDETTEEREQKELQEERGKHSTTKQHENTEAPWLNPPDKNFDAFKIAQDIILGQQSLSSGAKGNSEGLRSRKVSTKLEHVEGKIESEDVANLNLHSSSQMRNQKPAPILSRRKKNLRSLYVETELEDSNEGASGSKPMEEEFPVPHRVGKMSQLKNIVGKHTPSPTELALQKQQQRLSALGSHDNGSFQRQQSRSRQNNSGSGFFVENLTSADLAEIKFFSSILDRAAATGKLTRISPSATDTAQTTTSCKHGCGGTNGSSDATGDGAAGGTGLPPTFRSQLSSNTTSSLKAKRNSTVQPIPPPFPRSGPGSDLRQQHFHHKHKNHDASFAPAVSNGAPYSKWDCASYRLPSAKSILPGAISGAPSSNIMKDVPGYVRAPAGLLSADPGPVDANPMKKPRCFVCGKKTRIGATYSCRCEGVFCAQHRYAESHDCTFDYKSEGKKLLEYTNPVVTAPKLPKI